MDSNNLFHERYFLERLLGRGNFSEVWLAKDTKTDIQVALKIYAPATGLDDHGLNVLSREFAIVVNANQKNLLKPLYYDSFERKPYLVLPYCKNGSIQRSVGQFPEEQAWHLLHDVAAGLAYLHTMNPIVIHQDIKPDNIMIGDNGSYMITDFGVSAHAKSTLRKSMSLAFASAGTTAYMAPERFSKDNTPVKANDIYSLGATTYEMLTGDPPFGENGGLFQKRGAEIPELQGDYSPQLKRILEMCLQENPWDRPTAEQVEELAQIYLDGGDPFPGPEPLWKKFRIPFAVITGVIVIATMAVLITKFYPHQTTNVIQQPEVELTGIPKAQHLMMSPETAQEGLNVLTELSDASDADATYLLSRIYFKSKSASDATPDSIKAMQKALNIKADNMKAHQLLLKVIQINPRDYRALYEIGCDYLGGEDRTEAVERDIDKADHYFSESLKFAEEQGDKDYIELVHRQTEKYK